MKLHAGLYIRTHHWCLKSWAQFCKEYSEPQVVDWNVGLEAPLTMR